MDKTKMREAAKSIFGRYKDRDKVFITSDGQAFFDEAPALNHKVKNRTGKELGMETFLRDEVQDTDTGTPETAGSVVAPLPPRVTDTNTGAPETAKEIVAEMKDIDAVQAVLDAKKAGDNRKTVIEAGEKRIEELKA